eukprot:1830468-Rhodomonas_salina.2
MVRGDNTGKNHNGCYNGGLGPGKMLCWGGDGGALSCEHFWSRDRRAAGCKEAGCRGGRRRSHRLQGRRWQVDSIACQPRQGRSILCGALSLAGTAFWSR